MTFVLRHRWKLFLLGNVAGYSVYSYMRDREKCLQYGVSSSKLLALKFIPWNIMSRAAGYMASLEVPIGLRGPIYGSYAWMFNCKLDEMHAPNLKVFRTFNDFFGRELKKGMRAIDNAEVVSPCDGKVLVTGKIEAVSADMTIDQIKGVSYPLKHLIGEKEIRALESQLSDDRALYYCSMYLSPGTYHRFHAPVNRWDIQSVERVRGELFSVSPWFMRLVREVSFLNERMIASGSWRHGQMTMIPVGAANVGSILSSPHLKPGARLHQAEEVGRFNLGSMVILVLTAPKTFEWKVDPGQEVKLGSALLSFNPSQGRSWWSWFSGK